MSTLTTTAPRYRYVPTFSSSAGQDCIDLAEHAGLVLDPWQCEVVRDALGERPDGKWASTQVDLLVARQNGKGGILEAIELFFLFLVAECRLITHTAHRFDTCIDHFRRVRLLIENTPDLLEQVDDSGRRRSDGLPSGIKDSNGSESIKLKNRKILAFKAREKGSGRGFPGDLVVFDEAFYLGDLTGLVSSLSAAKNPQIWFASSHPLPRVESDPLRQIMRRGRRLAEEGGTAKDRITYIEFCCDDDDDLSTEESLIKANPGRLCGRLNEDVLAEERELYSPEQLARERYGVVSLDNVAAAWELFDKGMWDAGRVPAGRYEGPFTYAVEVTPDRSSCSVAAAGMHGDRVGVEVLHSGMYDEDDVLARLVKVADGAKGIVIDPNGPAKTLIRPLVELHGVETVPVSSQEFAAACESFYDAHRADLAHLEVDPPLDGAVAAARSKRRGDGFVFDRSGRDVTPLTAAALARWGHLEIEAPPPRSVYEDREPISL